MVLESFYKKMIKEIELKIQEITENSPKNYKEIAKLEGEKANFEKRLLEIKE